MPDFELEDGIAGPIAGVDEAGRGPWAGPVVAGAVILDRASMPESLHNGLDDSKKLSAKQRNELFRIIKDHAVIGIGRAEVAEIDTLNILQATMLAMHRAVDDLGIAPAMALVDGNREPPLSCPTRAIIKGDAKSMSIAAASIIAKVSRDKIMADLAMEHPGYGWERNAGYGTAEHKKALYRLGVTGHHRKSFKPIINILRS